MELKEHVKIIKQHKMLFFGVWILFAGFVMAWFFSRPQAFEAVMSIDIARQSGQESSQSQEEYDFDQYYRLEADKSFAETLVQWLGDPGVVNFVFSDSKTEASGKSLSSFSKFFKAERLSPNYVQVRYVTKNPPAAAAIFSSTKEIITKKTNSLNEESKDSNWFKTIFSGPVVAEKKLSFLPVFVGAVVGGLLLSIFSVLTRHYWKEE
ncbi:MAG: hypothetical protein U9O20_01640 [Patescibacteria group bacterium]|nr:hypothetical protein [Patescibacteria group bacterium]